MQLPTRAISRATAAAAALFATFAATSAVGAEDLAGMLRDAQALEQAGRLDEAAAIYARAHRASPKELEPARGLCEIGLKVAGDPPLSPTTVEACHAAFLAAQDPRGTRNKVAALLAEKQKPDLDTIALAALMAESAKKLAPDEPWGELARLDIARHLRRADLLATTRSDLERYVATSDVVRAALADNRIGRPSFWVWLLRALVLLGLAATAVHAFLNRTKGDERKHTTPAGVVVVVLAVLVSSLMPSRALAGAPEDVIKEGQLSPFKIDDAHPEAAVLKMQETTQDPLQLGYILQDLDVRIVAAKKANDNAAVARYYHAIAVAVPTTAFGPRKECEASEAAGDIPNAVIACREALTRAGSDVNDYARFVTLVLENPQPLPDQEPKELENVISHLEKTGKAGMLPVLLRCQAAMRFEDRGALDRCRAAIGGARDTDPTVIAIKWGLAVRDQDKARALALVEQAKNAGLSQVQVDKMVQTTNLMEKRGFQRKVVLAGVGVLAILAVLLGARSLASFRRRSATRSPA
jgi:hypothetical protein